MVAKRAPQRRKRRAPPVNGMAEAIKDFFVGSIGKAMATAAVTVTAFLYLFTSALKPVVDSGPLPVPSRAEVTTLRTDTDDKLKAVQKALDATAQSASAANVAAQNALSESNANRLDRLLQQKTNLQALLRMTPNDPTLQQALTKTDIDIADVTTRIRSAAGLLTQPSQVMAK